MSIYMISVLFLNMTEESPNNPPSKKGAVRKKIAQMVMEEVKAGKLMALIARSADFYGPGNEKSFVNEMFIEIFLKRKAANWFIDPDKKHSFTYTPDAARATALLGNTDDAYNTIWHLPTDKNTLTGREFIELFSREMKVANKVTVMPLWLIRILGFLCQY